MATQISQIEVLARRHLVETTASFWSSPELTDITIAGIRDLWRDIVDLKQEHYLIHNITDVSLPSNSDHLLGVPIDVHKVYMIEPRDLSENGANHGLVFEPRDYNTSIFQRARSISPIEAVNDVIFYAIHSQGAPVGAPTILIAPQVTSSIPLAFSYVPTLGSMTKDSIVPIPGEADNALKAWTIAYARAKETEDRVPDAGWLSIYASEKAHLMQSLGLRQYQAPSYTQAIYEEYW